MSLEEVCLYWKAPLIFHEYLKEIKREECISCNKENSEIKSCQKRYMTTNDQKEILLGIYKREHYYFKYFKP